MNAVFTQQIVALQAVNERLKDEIDVAVELIEKQKGKVVVTGIGKSGIIGHKIAATLASTGTSAVFLNAGEALHGDLGMVGSEDVVLMLSKSAKTVELLHMLPAIRKIGAAIIGILGAVDTPIAEACDVVLDVSVKDEACPLSLAPTTSTTASMVMGDALAVALMEKRGFTPDQFALYHPGGSLGRRLLYQVKDVMNTGKCLAQVSPTATLGEAVIELSRGKLGAVCIVDENQFIQGILTEGDVRRLFLEGGSAKLPVTKVMSVSPKIIHQNANLGEALDKMESGDLKVYVLPVVNEESKVVGMLRMHDIVTV